jgi:hypothetical protein
MAAVSSAVLLKLAAVAGVIWFISNKNKSTTTTATNTSPINQPGSISTTNLLPGTAGSVMLPDGSFGVAAMTPDFFPQLDPFGNLIPGVDSNGVIITVPSSVITDPILHFNSF